MVIYRTYSGHGCFLLLIFCELLQQIRKEKVATEQRKEGKEYGKANTQWFLWYLCLCVAAAEGAAKLGFGRGISTG